MDVMIQNQTQLGENHGVLFQELVKCVENINRLNHDVLARLERHVQPTASALPEVPSLNAVAPVADVPASPTRKMIPTSTKAVQTMATAPTYAPASLAELQSTPVTRE